MSCDKCNGNGFIITFDEEGRTLAKPCSCREVDIAKTRLAASGISEAFRKKTFDTFDTKNKKILETAKSKAIDYADKFKIIEHDICNSALFLGQVGSGKTHLSIAIANKLLDDGIGCLYIPYRETMLKLKQLAMNDKYAYELEMNKLTTARLIIIDDLFKGSITEADINYVFQIVNHRYLNQLPFVCSSEKDNHQLLEIDEAIGSRLIEQARGHSVLISNDSTLNHRVFG